MLMSRVGLVFVLAAAALGIGEPPRAAPSNKLPIVQNLSAVAQRAGELRLPILLMVSSTDCPYCSRLKCEIFEPMQLSGDYEDRVIMVELLIDDEGVLVDFDGSPVTPARIAERYRASTTPTVLLLDPRGAELARIPGVGSIDMYAYYLDRHIDEARAKVREGAW